MDDLIDHLRVMTTKLLTDENPEVIITVNGEKHHLQGNDAKMYGCGMQTVLKVIGYEAK